MTLKKLFVEFMEISAVRIGEEMIGEAVASAQKKGARRKKKQNIVTNGRTQADTSE